MPARFSIARARGGKYGFRLKASNGEIILASQVYASKTGAKGGVASVQNNCADDSRFERKKARNGKDYFVLKARNGQVIGKSEMYNTRRAMESGITSVRRNGKTARVADETG